MRAKGEGKGKKRRRLEAVGRQNRQVAHRARREEGRKQQADSSGLSLARPGETLHHGPLVNHVSVTLLDGNRDYLGKLLGGQDKGVPDSKGVVNKSVFFKYDKI